jgi:hypothetical protein
MESQCHIELFARMSRHDEGVDAFVLESCNSTWLFDTERMRFRRVLKGADVGRRPTTTEWRPYFRIDLDPRSESFVVVLNAEGTRLLRSWRHTHQCTQCGGQETVALSLDEIRAAG